MDLVSATAVLLLEYYKLRHKDAVAIETWEETRARVTMIAEQSVRACDEEFPAFGFPGGLPREACVALIATTAQWESGLWVTVHSGQQLGPSGEVCLVQIHRLATQIPVPRFKITKEEWSSLTGTDAAATLRCLRVGVRIHGYHWWRCGLKWQGVGDSAFTFQKSFAEYHLPSRNGKCYGLAPQAFSRGIYTRNMIYRLQALMTAPKTGLFQSPSVYPGVIFSASQDAYAVEHTWVKELPSLLGPLWGLQTPPGFTPITRELRLLTSFDSTRFESFSKKSTEMTFAQH